MGRPRHDALTRQALLAAAEGLVAEGGLAALQLRAVAQIAGTTTRAVYSVFGSKDGLLDALAARAFELLDDALDRLPRTDDPADDLIVFATKLYRPFVLEHPTLFRIAFQRIIPDMRATAELVEARRQATVRFQERLQRLNDRGLLGRKTTQQAMIEFNAMCEGLANIELRHGSLRVLPDGEEELVWEVAVTSLVQALRIPATPGALVDPVRRGGPRNRADTATRV